LVVIFVNNYFHVLCFSTSLTSINFRVFLTGIFFCFILSAYRSHLSSRLFLMTSMFRLFCLNRLTILMISLIYNYSLWLLYVCSNYELRSLCSSLWSDTLLTNFYISASAWSYSTLNAFWADMASCILKSGKYNYSISSLIFRLMLGRCSNLYRTYASFWSICLLFTCLSSLNFFSETGSFLSLIFLRLAMIFYRDIPKKHWSCSGRNIANWKSFIIIKIYPI
jgi:hypothetical protein